MNIAASQMQMRRNNSPCWKLGAEEVVVLHSWMALRGRVSEGIPDAAAKRLEMSECLEQ